MCGSATFATEVSSTSMNVASITVHAMIQGFTAGGASARVGDNGPAVVAMELLGEDGRVHVHARRDEGILRQIIEHDPHWDALDNFHEIACRILGRKQAHSRPSRCR